jgi:hypothetical protein
MQDTAAAAWMAQDPVNCFRRHHKGIAETDTSAYDASAAVAFNPNMPGWQDSWAQQCSRICCYSPGTDGIALLPLFAGSPDLVLL